MKKFRKSFECTSPIDSVGQENALQLIKAGALFRYMDKGDLCGVAEAEFEFAKYTGHKYVVGVNSCGCALFLALKAAGVKHNDKVFSNAFTFSAVPSSIVHAGGTPVYVECNRHHVMDVDDLRRKIDAHPDAKYLLLSYMRGHIADVDKIKALCDNAGIYLIEDCAHALGTKIFDKELGCYKHIGHHSRTACFSTRSAKLTNSGEGGFIATNDEYIAAFCMVAAGSYEQTYKRHIARPRNDSLFETLIPVTPNYSMRMSNLTASVLKCQISHIDEWVARYNENYKQLMDILADIDGIEVPRPLPGVVRVCDSLQLNLVGLNTAQIAEFVDTLTKRDVKVQIFGHKNNARNFRNWAYSYGEVPHLEQTERIIRKACDIRLPASFDSDDINLLGEIIKDAFNSIYYRRFRLPEVTQATIFRIEA